MASELFFYVTIDTFDEIITEFRSCCDGSTEMERELLQQTANMNNLLTEWKSHPGPYKWNYCPPDVSDDMLMKIELGTDLAMKMHLDGSNQRERALVARLTKMEDDFGKAMDAQEKKPSQDSQKPVSTGSSSTNSSGCYIATCAYGSYDCPEVWTLRRFRDQFLANRRWGRVFIQAYYAISPKLVERFGGIEWLRSGARACLDRFVLTCQKHGYENSPYRD